MAEFDVQGKSLPGIFFQTCTKETRVSAAFLEKFSPVEQGLLHNVYRNYLNIRLTRVPLQTGAKLPCCHVLQTASRFCSDRPTPPPRVRDTEWAIMPEGSQ